MGKLFGAVLTVLFLAGYVNNIIVCAANDSWGLLIAGAIIAPLGALHGLYLFFA
jgi:hypothetical protein